MRTIFSFLGLSFVAFLLAGCAPDPEPPRVCETAMECAQILTSQELSCRFTGAASSTNFFSVYNNHNSDKIYVTYEESVRHLNSERPNEKFVKMVSVNAGQNQSLGCFRTKGLLDGQFDEWSYTIISACFANQCPSPLPQKPGEIRDPRLTCEKACDQDDALCLKTELDMNSPVSGSLAKVLYQMNNAIKAGGTTVDMQPLVAASNAFTGTSACSRGDLEIRQSPTNTRPFINVGSTCPIGFKLSNPIARALHLSWPGELAGNADIKPGISYVMVPTNEAHAPQIDVTKTDNTVVRESISSVESSGPKMTFTGQKYYCFQVGFKGGG